MEETPQKPQPPKLDKWRAVSLAMDMGFVIVIPIVLFGFLGKYLDAKFDTKPWFTLSGIAAALITTTIWLTKRLKEYIK